MNEPYCRQDLFKFSTSSPAFKNHTARLNIFFVSSFHFVSLRMKFRRGWQLRPAIISPLRHHLPAGKRANFSPPAGGRGIVSNNADGVDALVAMRCTPPHDISDQPYASSLPEGPAAETLESYRRRAAAVLEGHPANDARRAAGDPPATSIWLWGQGQRPSLQPYPERFGLTGTVVSAVDLVKGIGICAGLESPDIPGATGYLDTDYNAKVTTALQALETQDFVYLHVEAPDETGHEGRSDLKIQAIEDFDAKVVQPCLDAARSRGDCRVLIAPDHITAISTKTHAGGPVPFVLCGPGIEPNGADGYSEVAAEETGLLLERGHALVPAMIEAPSLSAEILKNLAN